MIPLDERIRRMRMLDDADSTPLSTPSFQEEFDSQQQELQERIQQLAAVLATRQGQAEHLAEGLVQDIEAIELFGGHDQQVVNISDMITKLENEGVDLEQTLVKGSADLQKRRNKVKELQMTLIGLQKRMKEPYSWEEPMRELGKKVSVFVSKNT